MAVLNYDGERSYIGRVLSERERNGYHDSDFYAEVVTDSGVVRWVEFATTRGACGAAFGTYLDATSEALDAAEEFWRGEFYDSLKASDEGAARAPEKGKRVRLTRKYRSRKLGITLEAGTEGTVFWLGLDKYADSRLSPRYRAGVEFDEGKLFLNAGFKIAGLATPFGAISDGGLFHDGVVETVGWEDLLTSETELRERAAECAAGKRRNYERSLGGMYEAGRKRNAERDAAEAASRETEEVTA